MMEKATVSKATLCFFKKVTGVNSVKLLKYLFSIVLNLKLHRKSKKIENQ